MYFIQQQEGASTKTVDQFMCWDDAQRELYRLRQSQRCHKLPDGQTLIQDPIDAYYYLSQRACKGWT